MSFFKKLFGKSKEEQIEDNTSEFAIGEYINDIK